MIHDNRRIIFCLGSNLGDRKYNLNLAIDHLIYDLKLINIKKSSFLQNKAMILPNSPKEWDIDFLNMAMSADIDLVQFQPIAILDICKKIEKKLGRIDREKWSPREIDIDIAKISDLKINIKNKLTIPHPGIYDRDFFIKTILEIENI
ncbi:2-amino-4-hydroxy-6-hydroxymethyldihydropteridine diphosphokinase [Rickettsiales bacterium]|nr:2-amino-4-hydroxy-6-hydroxymethyldihydropteridine diphosphokinase [Rickettsiales bacterium]MDB2550455.1 2-amino-4-hydroxy-6-hydroxymethyldihydropteridine diphosphokinase [Rickettsiales bacterium]